MDEGGGIRWLGVTTAQKNVIPAAFSVLEPGPTPPGAPEDRPRARSSSSIATSDHPPLPPLSLPARPLPHPRRSDGSPPRARRGAMLERGTFHLDKQGERCSPLYNTPHNVICGGLWKT